MAEKMLVTQALDERDLLVKKISDKICKARFVDTVKCSETKVCEARMTREDFEKEAKDFEFIISNAKNEVEVQRYIKSNQKWFIPGAIFLDYNFGHYETYLFPEQKLGNDYIADYMLIGKSSGGYNLVLVEFETPNTEYLISTANMESESVRKGLTQLQDWKRWLDSNREYFMRNIGLREFGIDIPTYRTFYHLVVSRRKYMNKMEVEVREIGRAHV